MGAVDRPEPAQRSAPMRLCVHVLEARGLSAIYLNGTSDPYVRLQLGRRRAKTTVVKRSLSPSWDEAFGFLVASVAEELVVSVLNEDRYFSTDFLGRVRMPLSAILETEDHSLGTAWYQLQPKSGKSRRKKRGMFRSSFHPFRNPAMFFGCLSCFAIRFAVCTDCESKLSN
jgi:Ca2+-dependent lipid-binding protein